MPFRLLSFSLFSFFFVATASCAKATNVIVIVADDLGWHDLGFMQAGDPDPLTPDDLLTPNIDALATGGVRFTSGYVTAPVCSPSRAGLLTGRHQCRFGHETNPGITLEHNIAFGLPATESTIGDRFQAMGHATGWVGKSHLGWKDPNGPSNSPYHPNDRGFAEFFGFLESHHDYLGASALPKYFHDPIQHNGMPQSLLPGAYLTTALGTAAINFIQAHKTVPFLLYVPFSAAHFPFDGQHQAYASRFATLPNPPTGLRLELACAIAGLDDAVGAIMQTLLDSGLDSNTLVFFTSDNGGDISSQSAASNRPLRAGKTSVYEGGIRVPFLMRWPARLPAGLVVHTPVSTLDILPTAVAAAGGIVPSAWKLDGVNLLPYLLGQTTAVPHADLFWRIETNGASQAGGEAPDGVRAMRRDNWKLVKPGIDATWELYNLTTDIGEQNNLAASEPEKVQEMVAAFDTWAAEMARPRWAVDDLNFTTPAFVSEDLRIGSETVSYVDPEFHPDGMHLAFQDDLNTLWRGAVDPVTGFLSSVHGADESVDVNLAPLTLATSGAQWGTSSGGTALYYTKPDGLLHQQVWRALLGTTVTRTPLTTSAVSDSFGVRVSQWPAQPTAKVSFRFGSAASSATVWKDETSGGDGTVIPDHAGGAGNGRWIPGTADFAFAAHPPAAPTTTQIARHRTANGTAVMISDNLDPGQKTDVCAFHAPEFNNELCYAAVVDRSAIAIYRDPHTTPDNTFVRVAALALPATSPARFLYSMKPLHGAGGFNGVSWFSCAAYANDDPLSPGTTEMWLLGLGPDANHRITRRVDTGTSANRSDPETVIGTSEAFFYYTQDDGPGTTQLRHAATGLRRPDHTRAPGGFTGMSFDLSFAAGTAPSFGTETTHLIEHDGRLFAAQGSAGNNPAGGTWSGAQVLMKTSAGGSWQVDETFAAHGRVEAMKSVTFFREGSALIPPVKAIVSSMSDVTGIGELVASVRLRTPGGAWLDSHPANNPAYGPAFGTAFATHIDSLNEPGTTQYIFTGLSNGEIFRGVYDSNADGRITWIASEPLTPGTAPSLAGPVMSFAEANGLLYAACGLRQAGGTAPVAGGLYVRDDNSNSWSLVYRWPGPLPVFSAPPENRVMTGLTAVPDPLGAEHEVLLGCRSWPGVIERIDPALGNTVTVELDVRDFFARKWNSESVRGAGVRIGYNSFTPVTDPVTGEQVHLISLWVEHPGAPRPPHNGAHFLIRHRDGTYESGDIANFTPPLVAGDSLRATRCIAASPFATDGGGVFYFGGYDAATTTPNGTSGTAWIIRGGWTAWPDLTISQPDPPLIQLSWPPTGPGWVLEASGDLGAWQPVGDLPTRSLTGTTQSFTTNLPRGFFRLRKP